MKPCPFCAEEIQDAAIKCRYCGSFISASPPTSEEAKRQAQVQTPPVADPVPSAAQKLVPSLGKAPEPASNVRKILYSGYPSWRAYLQNYGTIALIAIVLPVFLYWLVAKFETTTMTKVLVIAIPILGALFAFGALHIYRKSKVVRVTSSNIELEHGLFSRNIDVLELWRCRDIRYRQSLLDRILGIAHIDIYTTDVTTPNVCIVGLPASRELFENLRDAIEIQRQSRNVVGMVS